MAHVTLIWQLLGNRVDLKAAHPKMRFMTTDGKLQKCPSCRYRLAGLPDVHQCPECGFEYDKRMVVIQQHAKIAWIWLGVNGMGIALALFVIVLSGTTPVVFYIMLIASFASIFPAARTVFFKRRHTALVWEGGLAFLLADGTNRGRYSWEQIHHVEYARFGGHVRLVGHDGSIVDRIAQAFFGSDRQTRSFVEIANRCRTECCGE
ncbi:MAG: hypothetical protein IID42_08300 [Planctomycetes bacterium]|nr:hypothetical protein [Planctomycetota bacterium]